MISIKEPDRLGFSLQELARRLGCSPGLLHLEVKRGRLRTVRIGRRVIVPSGEVERLLNLAERQG
jgi:hypothetical protein